MGRFSLKISKPLMTWIEVDIVVCVNMVGVSRVKNPANCRRINTTTRVKRKGDILLTCSLLLPSKDRCRRKSAAGLDTYTGHPALLAAMGWSGLDRVRR